MSAERDRLTQAVVEAARDVARVPNLDGRIIEALRHHLDALDALPAPAAEPEVAVWRDNDDGEVVFCIPKTERDGPLQGWTRLGTTRLALVPEVVGEVG